ncbi:MAG: AbgT family transporter [Lachnospirales bacterium]
MSNNQTSNNEVKQSWIVKVGRALPESNILFLYLIGIVCIASFFLQGTYASVVEGGNDIVVKNMLSLNGLNWFFYNAINNFRSYSPLGIVVVGVIGFGFAEKTGLLGSAIKKVGIITPEKFLLPVVVFLGINSSVASDAGYIVLIPLAGALYAGLGKHPLIGITAAFAGVSAGFGAALVPTPGDGLLGGITNDVLLANDMLLSDFGISNFVTMNYFFMIASTFFLTIVISLIGNKFVNKTVDAYTYTVPEDLHTASDLSDEETKALKAAGVALLVTIAVFIVLGFTALGSFTSNEAIGLAEKTNQTYVPIRDNIIVVMIIIFLVPSLVYGKKVGTITDSKSYIKLTVSAMSEIAYFLVFAIFAGNFIQIFNFSGLSTYISNQGAGMLMSMNMTSPILLMLGFIVVTAFVNLFMGSASAKWNILAVIFVPMLIQATGGEMGPDVIQAGYRVADSSTNVITPLMTYAGVILIACRRYIDDFEYGDMLALMMPYSLGILISWSIFYCIWLGLGLPFGF